MTKRKKSPQATKRKKEKVKRFLPGKSRWEKPKQNQLDGCFESMVTDQTSGITPGKEPSKGKVGNRQGKKKKGDPKK